MAAPRAPRAVSQGAGARDGGGSSSVSVSEASVTAFRDNYSLLKRLLHKNRQQHRHGRYFKELDMLRKAISRYLIRRSLSNAGAGGPSSSANVMEAAKSCGSSAVADAAAADGDALLLQQRSILVNCKQLQRVGLLVARCASSLTSLVSRTHFLPFSVTILSILARIRLLAAQILSDNVHHYNNNSNNRSTGGSDSSSMNGEKKKKNFLHPEFLQLQLEHRPYPKVLCHFTSPSCAVQAGASGEITQPVATGATTITTMMVDFGEKVLERGGGDEDDLMEMDFEEERQKLPVVDDQDTTGPAPTGFSNKDNQQDSSRRPFGNKKQKQKNRNKIQQNHLRGNKQKSNDDSNKATGRASTYQKMFDDGKEKEEEKAAILKGKAVSSSSKGKERDKDAARSMPVPVPAVAAAAPIKEDSEKTLTGKRQNSRLAFVSVGDKAPPLLSQPKAKANSSSKLFGGGSGGGGGFAGMMQMQGGGRDSQQAMDDIFSQLGKKKKKKKKRPVG